MLMTFAAAALALAQPGLDPGMRPNQDDVPSMTVNVYASRGVMPHLVTETLDEAGAVWTTTGITLAWRVVTGGRPEYSATPHVVINDDVGQTPRGGQTPIGWVQFRHPDEPDQEIHISRGNGMKLLRASTGFGRSVDQMPPAEVDTLLGRMLGRALAHELGHYLLRSPTHTRFGLMRGDRTVQEFLAPGRLGFAVDALQRRVVADRIREMTGAST
jgi:hypothetical protein